jgi:probable HAF family extracellular repeat protein
MKFKKLASCLGLLFGATTCFAQMYTVTDLGTLGGSLSQASGINASGQVVGTSSSPDNLSHAFRTAPNSPINPTTDDLVTSAPCTATPDPTAVCAAWGSAINDSAQVAGWLNLRSLGIGDIQPFRTSANTPIEVPDDLVVPSSGGFFGYGAFAHGINNGGQVVGAWTLHQYPRAWRTAANGSPLVGYDIGKLDPQDTDNFAGATPYGINDSGEAVGCSNIAANGPLHAFRTASNSPINPATDDLGTLSGSGSCATGINAFGQVVGSSSTSNDAAVHAFRTAPEAAINPATDDLGTLGGSFSGATSINNSGQVVGWSSLAGDTVQHAFLYDGGTMRDLNNLIAGGASCVLSGQQINAANSPDINDAGQIAANVSCNGQVHAVRLDPAYKAFVRPPINADGSKVFKARRGVVPVKFTLTQYNAPTCTLPPATIAITRATSDTLASVDESIYSTQADDGSNFRIDPNACQYIYNLGASSLGVGTYRVDISIEGIMVGHAVFALK